MNKKEKTLASLVIQENKKNPEYFSCFEDITEEDYDKMALTCVKLMHWYYTKKLSMAELVEEFEKQGLKITTLSQAFVLGLKVSLTLERVQADKSVLAAMFLRGFFEEMGIEDPLDNDEHLKETQERMKKEARKDNEERLPSNLGSLFRRKK